MYTDFDLSNIALDFIDFIEMWYKNDGQLNYFTVH